MRIRVRNFDLERYISERGAKVLNKSKGEFVMDCPNPMCPNPEQHLAVNIKTGKWQCFICNRRFGGKFGGGEALVGFSQGISHDQAVQWILDEYGIHRTDSLDNLVKNHLDILDDTAYAKDFAPYPYPRGFTSLVGKRCQYLDDRRVDNEAINRMRLGIAENRLVFPVFDALGRLIFYQGRIMVHGVLQKGVAKTKNPFQKPGLAGKSDVLLNIDSACTFPTTRIVEGGFDCTQSGPNAVAIFGKVISAKQTAALLARGVTSVELALDPGDPNNYKEYKKQKELIRYTANNLSALFKKVTIVKIPEGTDPGEYLPHESAQFEQEIVKTRIASNDLGFNQLQIPL